MSVVTLLQILPFFLQLFQILGLGKCCVTYLCWVIFCCWEFGQNSWVLNNLDSWIPFTLTTNTTTNTSTLHMTWNICITQKFWPLVLRSHSLPFPVLSSLHYVCFLVLNLYKFPVAIFSGLSFLNVGSLYHPLAGHSDNSSGYSSDCPTDDHCHRIGLWCVFLLRSCCLGTTRFR